MIHSAKQNIYINYHVWSSVICPRQHKIVVVIHSMSMGVPLLCSRALWVRKEGMLKLLRKGAHSEVQFVAFSTWQTVFSWLTDNAWELSGGGEAVLTDSSLPSL